MPLHKTHVTIRLKTQKAGFSYIVIPGNPICLYTFNLILIVIEYNSRMLSAVA